MNANPAMWGKVEAVSANNHTDIVWDKETKLGLLVLAVFALAIVGGFYVMCGESAEERDARLDAEAEATRVAAVETETEPTAQPEFVPISEIWLKWIDEQGRYNDPASFVFSGWKRPGGIRTTGLVFEKSKSPDVLNSGLDGFDVYFHDGNGDKDLVDGVWKWTGWNKGVYAHFDDVSDMEKVQLDEFLTVTCTHVEPQVDRESGTLFGLELQDCSKQ